jgi:hypothetical protein
MIVDGEGGVEHRWCRWAESGVAGSETKDRIGETGVILATGQSSVC